MPTNDSSGVIIKELFIVAMALSELFLILLSLIMSLKLLPSRISWPLFALFLSRVRPVHAFVSRQKSTQAMRPCRQHLLLNKL